MTEETQSESAAEAVPPPTEAVSPATVGPTNGAAPPVPPAQEPAAAQEAQAAADRPELIVGAAFVIGFTIALILKRLVR